MEGLDLAWRLLISGAFTAWVFYRIGYVLGRADANLINNKEKENTDMPKKIKHIEILPPKRGKWYYRAVARNNEVIDGSQGYTAKSSAKRAARNLYGADVKIVEATK